MSVQIGTATGYDDLLNKLDTFLTSTGMALTPSFTGVGNGTISALGGSAGVAEVITVTLTSATAFSVAGSVSGALGTGTVGVAFASTKANLTLTAGSTAFVACDAFTFSVCPPWTSLRRTAGSEMIWQAPGNGGLDQIIVGAKTFFDVAGDYYNWRLGGFTGFNAATVFNQQAGYISNSQAASSPCLNLWNQSTPYWIIANGRRVIVVAKVSTVYVCAYLGFMNSYMSPAAFAYPLVVGGSLAWFSEPALAGNANWRWSYTGQEIRNCPIPISAPNSGADQQSSLRLRLPMGTWRGFDLQAAETLIGHVWPYLSGFTAWRTNLDGSYVLLPIILSDNTPNVYGELDGVFAVTGFQNAAENTITIGRVTYLVVQNVFLTTQASYFAVRLT